MYVRVHSKIPAGRKNPEYRRTMKLKPRKNCPSTNRALNMHLSRVSVSHSRFTTHFPERHNLPLAQARKHHGSRYLIPPDYCRGDCADSKAAECAH